ncbi:MAG: hypothetical protein ACJ77K_16600 [Bacteroidia bacterium]
MKALKFQVVTLSFLFICGISSCVVVSKTDNGKHKGWYKNPHNPHNPLSNNPGHTKSSPGNSGKSPSNGNGNGNGNGKGKGKGK